MKARKPDPAMLERLRILDRLGEEISLAVRELYASLARAPATEFHFPTGAAAARAAGYAEEDLRHVPPSALERFAGVACPWKHERARPGERVLDLGCGAGTDLVIAARSVGDAGAVTGLDLTDAMVAAARATLAEAEIRNGAVVQARAPQLPPAPAPFDRVISNGVLNLVPDKDGTLRRLHQLLRPGGRLILADIALERPPAAACLARADLWAECLVGAFTEEDYLAALERTGFGEVKVHERRDYFATSPSEETRETARDLGGFAWVVSATRA